MSKLNCVSIHLHDDELQKLEEIWRTDFTVRSRGEYIKKAINAYAGKEICEFRIRGFKPKTKGEP